MGKEPVKGLATDRVAGQRTSILSILEDVRFGGSMATWTRTLQAASRRANFRSEGHADDGHRRAAAQSTDHPLLPRSWAKARVNALLEKIEPRRRRPGQHRRIIRLSKNTKFVTPYTSFLRRPARCYALA